MNDIIDYISIFSVIVPVFTGLYFFRRHDVTGKLILGMILFACVPQLSAVVGMHENHRHLAYNIYACSEPVIWGLVFYINIRINRFLYVILALISVFMGCFIYLVLTEGITARFFSEMVCISNMMQIICVLVYFYELYQSDNLYKLEMKPLFWFSMSILVYAPCTYYFFALRSMAVNVKDPYFVILMDMHGIFNTVYYFLLAIGLFITTRNNYKQFALEY